MPFPSLPHPSRPLLAGLGLLLVLVCTLASQIPLPAPGTAQQENFDLLGTSATAALPTGWSGVAWSSGLAESFGVIRRIPASGWAS